MRRTLFRLLILSALLLAWPSSAAHATGSGCSFEADGSITCVQGGGECNGCENGGVNGGITGNGGTGAGGPDPAACTPGATLRVQRYTPDEFGSCTMYEAIVDQCSGAVLDIIDSVHEEIACPNMESPAPVSHPCQSLIVTPGGVTCNGCGEGWEIRTTVQFPETFLDVRPFPATLVRWPTAARNGGQSPASGSGFLPYVPQGGGAPGSPAVGDWANLTLTLTLNPAGAMRISLPHIGSLDLPAQGGTGTPTIFQWEVPSHPEAGGGPLAGGVSGMEELPDDLPLFVGSGRSPYHLSWSLSYLRYEAEEECVTGPNANGNYNCGGGTGHKIVVGYLWRRHASGGEIAPDEVTSLPAYLAADLDQDGHPDAYWNLNLTLRRMDDADRVDNPLYARSWNWGGAIYWGVREGQGQIGWPGLE